MAGTIKRTNPGDAANIFVRCMLSDISDLLGGFSNEDLERTVEYFDYKCPYTGEDISVEYKTGKWVLDHLIPHNRESVGLNLYGNIIVTTRKTNAAKSAKSFEDFIRYETKGTDEEKEKRIQKIRNFQKESGYFNKVKNIDEIKELCKKEYDNIQTRLKEHISDYNRIIEIETIYKTELRKVSFEKNIQNNNFTKFNTQSINNIRSEKMTKSAAISLFGCNGFSVIGNITFASENASYGRKFWANPKIEFLKQDWWLILNDIDKQEIHLFFIPANSLSNRDICPRSDKPDRIDLQINYNDYNFEDSRSKICFKEYFKKTIKYSKIETLSDNLSQKKNLI